MRLHDILFLSARTLKVFDLSVSLTNDSLASTGLLVELEAMAGRNMLEAFSFDLWAGENVKVNVVGSIFRQVGEVLVKPGWSASVLRQVSFKLGIRPTKYGAKLSKATQSLPDKYLSHLLKLESVTFDFSAQLY